MSYQALPVEKKWRERWEKDRLYHTDLNNNQATPFYNLTMFPYPSAQALHVGHIYNYGGVDTFGRHKKMLGYNVFEPMGFDAFGIHAENYAMKIKEHPQTVVPRNIEYFREKQMKRIGTMFDWDRQIDTTNPRYYQWTQWIFLQLFKAGLAYQKVSAVDWCPNCLTVLAKEQIENGLCERCQAVTIQKELKQWFFRITDYADKLLAGLADIDWPEKTKTLQKNWIGRSQGVVISFVEPQEDVCLECFTTRPDTLFGVTYLVMAPEHPLVKKITTDKQKQAVEKYQEQTAFKDERERQMNKTKTGVDTGARVKHPFTGDLIPVWVADYVLATYATGIVMGVPAHDERDYEFAQKFELPIKNVIEPPQGHDKPFADAYFGKEGDIVNSDFLNGLSIDDGIKKAIQELEARQLGKPETTYRLHDWCISRQRYWGPPIPIIYCLDCGVVPVPEEDLPVVLPPLENYQPDGSGKGPLANCPEFIETTCPKCKKTAQRETDVSDTFLDSSWYFLRYLSPQKEDAAFDQELVKKWLPLDMYIGGVEHATMHLLYFRFITMVLHDQGWLPFSEPAKKLRHQGLIIKDGAKMSKSRGNVINPIEYIQKYGADAFRVYMLFIGPYEEGGDFNDSGIMGVVRFFEKLWQLFVESPPKAFSKEKSVDADKLHKSIKKVGEDLENFHFNTAISTLMELTNWLKDNQDKFTQKQWADITSVVPRLLAPLAPFLAEEIWEKLGHDYSIHQTSWPEYDSQKLIASTCSIAVQVNGKMRHSFVIDRELASQEKVQELAQKEPEVARWLKGKEIRKVIYVPERLLNFVVI